MLLGAVGLIALAVDGNLFYRTLVDMNEVFWNFSALEKDPAAVRIEVNAHQWAWLARYPGPDGKFGTEDDIVTLTTSGSRWAFRWSSSSPRPTSSTASTCRTSG